MSSCISNVEGTIATSLPRLSFHTMDNDLYDDYYDDLTPEVFPYEPFESVETNYSPTISFSPVRPPQSEDRLKFFSSEEHRDEEENSADVDTTSIPNQESGELGENLTCPDALSLEKALDEAVGDALSLCYIDENEQENQYLQLMEDLQLDSAVESAFSTTILPSNTVAESSAAVKLALPHRISLTPQTTRVLVDSSTRGTDKVYTSLTTTDISQQFANGNRKRPNSTITIAQSKAKYQFTNLSYDSDLDQEIGAIFCIGKDEQISASDDMTMSLLNRTDAGAGAQLMSNNEETHGAPESCSRSTPDESSSSPAPSSSNFQEQHIQTAPMLTRKKIIAPHSSPMESEQLEQVRLELKQKIAQLAEWKNAAHAAFDAARKIRAQMELEKARADKAESRITQMTSSSRTKRSKAKARSSNFKEGNSVTLSNNQERSQAVSVTKNVDNEQRTRGAVEKMKSPFAKPEEGGAIISHCAGSKTRKDARSVNLTKTKQGKVGGINSCVRLALRAKVCSVNSSTLHTASDVVSETETLLRDLPLTP